MVVVFFSFEVGVKFKDSNSNAPVTTSALVRWYRENVGWAPELKHLIITHLTFVLRSSLAAIAMQPSSIKELQECRSSV